MERVFRNKLDEKRKFEKSNSSELLRKILSRFIRRKGSWVASISVTLKSSRSIADRSQVNSKVGFWKQEISFGKSLLILFAFRLAFRLAFRNFIKPFAIEKAFWEISSLQNYVRNLPVCSLVNSSEMSRQFSHESRNRFVIKTISSLRTISFLINLRPSRSNTVYPEGLLATSINEVTLN